MSERRLVALDGSPRRGSSVDQLLEAMGAGARDAGGGFEHFRAYEMDVKPCIACGPEPTTGYCIFHDAMDPVYAALEGAHAVAVGTPIYFDSVSAPLKLVIDRCNCVTMLMHTDDGSTKFRPQWRRTRRGVFVAVSGERNVWNLAERTVRGFMKWTGTKWEETLVYQHDDNALGSVDQHPELLARARDRTAAHREPAARARTRTGKESAMRYAIVILVLISMVGCAPKKAETKAPLTERQRDSILATEPLPGASTVGAALKASDQAAASAAKMNAQVDSLTH